MARLKILKTYKLYIAGQFPRSESGRYYELTDQKGKTLANVSMASRKDFRNAVVAARSAQTGWQEKSAMNRAQILYRMAEMLEGRYKQFVDELQYMGISKHKAEEEVARCINRLVYYAGACDKFQQIFSSVNPVATSHYNFSVPEAMGVVAVIPPENFGLLGTISTMAPIIAGGNTCIILAPEHLPLAAVSFAEVLAHSDLPAGVVNILSGDIDELHEHFSSHMDVNAMLYCGKNKKHLKAMQECSSLNVKRFFHWSLDWEEDSAQSPYLIMDLQEIKTTWHPIEKTGPSGIKY
ncbi:MAG: aldehyde dehydrogenase family protein [Bacteroidia bacterium]|jgi:acyl-CoA reductase-like NAD-dependent aldehyde dehydrogenase|nr:aldehyde dehydrogenase family protein [Bacteroidia bacterium]